MIKTVKQAQKTKLPSMKTLCLAIAAQTLAAGYCHAGPTGGEVVDGAGSIEQLDNTTIIDQDSHRLSLREMAECSLTVCSTVK